MSKLGLVTLSTLALAISSASTSAATINVDNYTGADNNGRGNAFGSKLKLRMSDRFMSRGTYRNVQKVAVKRRNDNGTRSDKNTVWWVDDSTIDFSLGRARTKLLNGSKNEFHWKFTDQNAVALPSAVPVPAAAWLFGSGLIGLVGAARRK